MLKTIRSYCIEDMLESLIYRLTDFEYARREDAETAFKVLRKTHPDSQLREQKVVYDLTKPEELRRYEAHIKRLR